MSALQPREVRCGDELIVAEQERVPGVVVADVGPPAVDLERGNAALKPIRAVDAGYSQDVQPEVRLDVEAFRADPLAGVADVYVQKELRIEDVSPSGANDLNPARGSPKLPAVQSRAADLPKDRRVNDESRRDAVAANNVSLSPET